MEFNQINGIVGDLLTVRGAQFRPFELHNCDYPIAKKNTVHAKSATFEIKLK